MSRCGEVADHTHTPFHVRNVGIWEVTEDTNTTITRATQQRTTLMSLSYVLDVTMAFTGTTTEAAIDMGDSTKIEWATMSFNPWRGCTKVSEGCENCYAETLSHRNPALLGVWGKGKPRVLASDAMWKKPIKWNREARNFLVSWERFKETQGKTDQDLMEEFCAPERPRVFCASLADWLDDEVPIEWLARLISLIHQTPNLDWLLLTKRPQNWRPRLIEAAGCFNCTGNIVIDWLDGLAPTNVWVGTTTENQARAKERIPLLLEIPAKVRFLSVEPMLGPIDLRAMDLSGDGSLNRYWPLEGAHITDGMNEPCVFPGAQCVHWVICGGESGPGARPFEADWARSLRDQCAAAGVPFFMKQMGGVRKPFLEIPEDLAVRQFPIP